MKSRPKEAKRELSAKAPIDSDFPLRYSKRVLWIKKPITNRTGPQMTKEIRGLIPRKVYSVQVPKAPSIINSP